jgi:putative photosynthetic complex assembly protein 2
MRWSTKLNIFLGVRNLHQEFWPVHLQYLRSYAREKTMNRLFPWSILAAAVAIGFFVMIALDTATSAVQRTGATLLVGILVLATLEHLFLMMKIPDDRLWRIATRSRQQAG